MSERDTFRIEGVCWCPGTATLQQVRLGGHTVACTQARKGWACDSIHRRDLNRLAEAEKERDERITEHEYRERSQKWVDTVCHYRNLAIELGAPPARMLSEYDKGLATDKTTASDEGWTDDTPELWEELERAEARVAAFEAALREVREKIEEADEVAVAALAAVREEET